MPCKHCYGVRFPASPLHPLHASQVKFLPLKESTLGSTPRQRTDCWAVGVIGSVAGSYPVGPRSLLGRPTLSVLTSRSNGENVNTIMKIMGFKQWLESVASEDDPFVASEEPLIVVFKYVVPPMSPEDADNMAHINQGIHAAIQHSKQYKFAERPWADEKKFSWDPSAVKPGEGKFISPPEGYWRLHKIFSMPADSVHRNWLTSSSDTWFRSSHEMDMANDEASKIVQEEKNVYASIVAAIKRGEKGRFNGFSSLEYKTAFIATSLRKNGKKSVSRIKNTQVFSSLPKTGMSNAIAKLSERFGMGTAQLGNLRLYDFKHNDLLDQIYGGQLKSWEWRLALTPGGWVVANRNGVPDRIMTNIHLGYSSPSDHVADYNHHMRGTPRRTHYIVAAVQMNKGLWTTEKLVFASGDGYHELSEFEMGQYRQCQKQARPDYVKIYGDYNHRNDCEYYIKSIDNKLARLDSLINSIPWMNSHVEKIANPFKIDPNEWDDIVSRAIAAAHIDGQTAEPTVAEPK